MGRRKKELKLISNRKRRCVTYQKRKKGLEKKAYELSTLCDVKVCLIMYGPKENTENQTPEPNIWPENPEFVSSMIGSYQDQLESNKKIRTQDLSTFYERVKKRDERKNNVNAVKYPTWNERLNRMSACELSNVISELDVKIKAAEERIDFLKGKRITVSPQTPDLPPPPLVSRGLVGTSSLQMESIQQTSYNINPAMINHDGRHLVAAATDVRVTKNRVMMTKVEPMPSSLLSCAQPAAVMRPYLQNLPAATLPYGCNLPAAVIPYGQYQWMHYSDNVMRSGYYP
ncbi:PREDICTED: agamous-like MADS-box protein AGL82 [Ipomoea nil]|uniref:agamous-like MADS-box protein AGL82 n=1 Tax=Ipomoea nil TaxID=35883 RepID=UPI000901BE5F|nr:PREDICTED: agamous-like MADS-box protein AGL82 [Ipomoea nil]